MPSNLGIPARLKAVLMINFHVGFLTVLRDLMSIPYSLHTPFLTLCLLGLSQVIRS